MISFIRKINNWLLPIMIVLFILEIFTFPYVISITYSDRSESPNHIITYTTNKLKWDNNTNINSNGSARLTLFDVSYAGVESENTDKVVAPGTNGTNIIRLRNASDNKIQYTAVLYKYTTTDRLPINISLQGKDFTTTKDYHLPTKIDEDEIEIIRAVKGTLTRQKIQDFDINWQWTFFESHEQDRIDTMLGNKEKLDEILVGFYIVVEDNSSVIDDDRPGGGSIIIIKPTDPPHDPDNPDDPTTPDKPIDPDQPIDPNDPNQPEQPDNPDIPIDPDNPNDPTIPDTPDTPITPDNPEKDDEKDNPNIIHPEIPQTGDNRLFEMYLTLMIISGIILILLIIDKRMEKRRK